MTTVLGKRLKEARLRLDLTQAEIGVRAGMDASVASTRINQYERGVHFPGLSVVERLAKAVDVPTPFLYAEDDQVAAWILAFPKTSASNRRAIIDKAGTNPRKQ